MKAIWPVFILMIVTVPLAGEFKVYPFQDAFRVSLGPPVFFFFLLWMRRVPPVLSGLAVGIGVVLFRIAMDSGFDSGFSLGASFQVHYSVFFYYLTYAAVLAIAGLERYRRRPLLIGLLGTSAEILSNIAELSLRHSLLGGGTTWLYAGQIVLIAVIRSFFVLGFYHILTLRQVQLAGEQQKRQNERLLLMISNIYEETVQLRKTLQMAENITKDAYDLYKSLKPRGVPSESGELAGQALRISGLVHEIKKDNQRIYAGLAKVIAEESPADYMTPKEIGALAVRTNEKYADALGKAVSFLLQADEGLPPVHAYTTLSLLNNLAVNAVEAIREKGTVSVTLTGEGDWLEIRVADDGPGIPPAKRNVIFTPGYTTKYDASGKPSTGVGLAYVKEMTESLGGQVLLEDTAENGGTAFILRLPVSGISGKG